MEHLTASRECTERGFFFLAGNVANITRYFIAVLDFAFRSCSIMKLETQTNKTTKQNYSLWGCVRGVLLCYPLTWHAHA